VIRVRARWLLLLYLGMNVMGVCWCGGGVCVATKSNKLKMVLQSGDKRSPVDPIQENSKFD